MVRRTAHPLRRTIASALDLLDTRPGAMAAIGTIAALLSPLVLLVEAAGWARVPATWAIAAALCAALGVVLSTRRHRLISDAHDELERVRKAMHAQMLRDPLTGLANRSAFHRELDRLSEAGGPATILFFDLDRFKAVNDTLGHKAGDLLLVEVAQRARRVLAEASVIARLGGDEFAAIIPSASRAPEDYGLAIVDAVAHPVEIEGKKVEVGASVGIAVGNPRLDGAHELLRRADIAMYEAKGSERGTYRLFDDVLDGRQHLESTIRIELGQSIIANALELHYQPIVDARTGLLCSAEALLRWRSEEIGDVSPATIIPIAEDSGQIQELTDWTLGAAFQAIRALGDVPVAINISPLYFRQADFTQRVFDHMLAAGIRPEQLYLELTEGVLIENFDLARQALGRLRDVGMKVYLDDFGTGYSSLSYLQHFELDGLKLDKSFLRNAGKKKQSNQIIRAVIEFGHSLDMKVVVEGIESDWQARLVQLLGCDMMQGFGIGVPTPLEGLLAFAEAHREAAAGDGSPLKAVG